MKIQEAINAFNASDVELVINQFPELGIKINDLLKAESKRRSREQQLVDIMFEVAIKIHNNPWFQKKDHMEVAAWIREQMNDCGFKLTPMGCSHGVLE